MDTLETLPKDVEAPGKFYLGRKYDLATKTLGDALLYDSSDLVTHGVCVGMTGSGKTGLCIGLLEEAALAGVPAIAIDPKGDLVDLLLAFPELRAEDFLPWINQAEAAQQQMSPQEFAQRQAQTWRKGLEEWGQDPDRIRRLKETADFVIYTPGSQAGLPVSILKSFAAPPEAARADDEALRERVNTAVTSLLGLVGVTADPIQSREHILLSRLFYDAWTAGRDLDLAQLVQQVQSPPFEQVGVLPLESFFPTGDRTQLAMLLNNLLASPAFQTWLQGETLDIGRMLHAEDGRPRVSIFSIAHLSDSERIFFVSMLLNEVLGWMRAQPGTSSLRAILYMDEVFGYFPPVAEPPTKRPLLTLLKQARAFGLGVLLATQNPVDLDYKGLANAGTWFIGRLQTERDKARLLEGLEGVSAGSEAKFDRGEMEETLAGLGKRVFLLYNVHEKQPVTFQTRWTLSYLAGPLTRAQIKMLMDPRRPAAPAPSPGTVAAGTAGQIVSTEPSQRPSPGPTPESLAAGLSGQPPALSPEIPQYFLPVRGDVPAGAQLVYRGAVLASAVVNFVSSPSGRSYPIRVTRLVEAPESALALDWSASQEPDEAIEDLERQPREGAAFAPLPAAMTKVASYRAWAKDFSDWVFRTQSLELLRSPGFKMISEPGESEEDFRARVHRTATAERDEKARSISQRYAAKKDTLKQRILRAEHAKARESEQAKGRKFQTAISLGATIIGFALGRGRLGAGTLGRGTTAMRDIGRSFDEQSDVKRAEETLAVLKQKLTELEEEEKAALAALDSGTDLAAEELEKILLRPRKSDISVDRLGLTWVPYWQ